MKFLAAHFLCYLSEEAYDERYPRSNALVELCEVYDQLIFCCKDIVSLYASKKMYLEDWDSPQKEEVLLLKELKVSG